MRICCSENKIQLIPTKIYWILIPLIKTLLNTQFYVYSQQINIECVRYGNMGEEKHSYATRGSFTANITRNQHKLKTNIVRNRLF
jgi:hypothetical protein